MNLILLNFTIITLLLIFEPIIAARNSSSTTKKTSTAPFVKSSTTKISHNISSFKSTTFHSTLLTKLSTKKILISTKKIATTTRESVKTIQPTDKTQTKKISYLPLIIVGSISAVIVSCVTIYVLYIQYFKGGNRLIGGPVTENGLQLNSISNDVFDNQPSTSYSNRGIAAFHEVSNEYIQKGKS